MYDPEGLALNVIRDFENIVDMTPAEEVVLDEVIQSCDVPLGRIFASKYDGWAREVLFYINTEGGAVYFYGMSCKLLDDEKKLTTAFDSDETTYYYDDRYSTKPTDIDTLIMKTLEYYADDLRQLGINVDDIYTDNWKDCFTDIGLALAKPR